MTHKRTYMEARHTTITLQDLHGAIVARLEELPYEAQSIKDIATIEFDFCSTRPGEIEIFLYNDSGRRKGLEELHVGIRTSTSGPRMGARELADRLTAVLEDNDKEEVQARTPIWALGSERYSETGIKGVHREGLTLIIDTEKRENKTLRIVQGNDRPYFIVPVKQEKNGTIFQRETVIDGTQHLHQLRLPITGSTVEDNWNNYRYWMQAQYVLSASCVMTCMLTRTALAHQLSDTQKDPNNEREIMTWATLGRAFEKVHVGIEDVVWARLHGREKLVWLGLKRLMEMWVNLRALRAGGEDAIKEVWNRDKALTVHERGAQFIDQGVQTIGGDSTTAAQDAVRAAYERIQKSDPEWTRHRNPDFWWIPELGKKRKTLRDIYEWTRKKGIESALDKDEALAGIMEMAWYMCNYISHEMRTPIDTLEMTARRKEKQLKAESAVEGWEMMIAHGIAIDVHNVVTAVLRFEIRGTKEIVGALHKDVAELVLGDNSPN